MRFHFINNFSTTLAEEADVSDTTLTVEDASGIGEIPEDKVVAITLISPVNDSNVEIVYCSSDPVGNGIQVSRAQEGTQAGGINNDPWPIGTRVEARITAAMLNSAPSGFDNSAGALGMGATNVQASRTNPNNRASGPYSVVVGDAKAGGYGAVAVGNQASTDGYGSPSVAVGNAAKAHGSVSVALGNSAQASGDSSTAVGNGAQASEDAPASLALGTGSVAGSPAQIALLSGDGIISGRDAAEGIFMMTNKTRAFVGSRHISGLEFVDQSLFISAAPLEYAARKTTSEVTLYSAPRQIGDQGWQPETEYVRGQAIAPGNGYSYVAMIPFGDGTEHTATSGSVEPSWSTTPGSATIDGDVTWYCHTLDATWLVPDYARFVPLRALVIATHVSRGMSPVEAEVSVGVDGEMDKWLGATFLSASRLSGPGGTEILELENSEWAQQFGFELTAPAEDVDMTVIFALQGIVVESPIP